MEKNGHLECELNHHQREFLCSTDFMTLLSAFIMRSIKEI